MGVDIPSITPWNSVKGVVCFLNGLRYGSELPQVVRHCQDKWTNYHDTVHILLSVCDSDDSARQWLRAFSGFISLRSEDIKTMGLAQDQPMAFRRP